MKWKVSIEKTNNGFVLNGTDAQYVFQEDITIEDEEEKEQKCIAELFYQLMEEFGVFNSKHNKTRLKIDVVKQNEDN